MIGSFPYGTLATVSDRGVVRKETFLPHSLGYSIEDTSRKIDILIGHDFGKPIASRQSGTLQIRDTPRAVEFEAQRCPILRHRGLWIWKGRSWPAL